MQHQNKARSSSGVDFCLVQILGSFVRWAFSTVPAFSKRVFVSSVDSERKGLARLGWARIAL